MSDVNMKGADQRVNEFSSCSRLPEEKKLSTLRLQRLTLKKQAFWMPQTFTSKLYKKDEARFVRETGQLRFEFKERVEISFRTGNGLKSIFYLT